MAYSLPHSTPLSALLLAVVAAYAAPSAVNEPQQRIDYLSLAHGAVPVAFEGNAKELGVGTDEALQAIDGNDGGYALTPRPGGAHTSITFVYKLPA